MVTDWLGPPEVVRVFDPATRTWAYVEPSAKINPDRMVEIREDRPACTCAWCAMFPDPFRQPEPIEAPGMLRGLLYPLRCLWWGLGLAAVHRRLAARAPSWDYALAHEAERIARDAADLQERMTSTHALLVELDRKGAPRIYLDQNGDPAIIRRRYAR